MILPYQSFINTDCPAMQLLAGVVGLSFLTFVGINAVETIGRTYRQYRGSLSSKIDGARALWSAAVPALLMAAPVAVIIAAPLVILDSVPSLIAIAAPDLVAGAAPLSSILPA